MHSAPAVSAVTHRCHAALSLLLVVGCAAMVATVVAADSSEFVFASPALPAFSLGITAASIYGWWTSPSGRISWDGQHWTWSGFAQDPECNVAIQLDFQWCVLLRLRNGRGANAWVFLQQKNNGAVWSALRRALLAGSDGAP